MWSATGVALMPPGAADDEGFFYARAQPITLSSEGTLVVVDSAAIERWEPRSTTRDTVAFVAYEVPPGSRVEMGTLVHPVPRRPTAFGTRTEWAVARDGRLAIVTVDPYQVRFAMPGGQVQTGPPIVYEPLRVTEGHKRQWRTQQENTMGITVIRTGTGEPQVVQSRSNVVEPEWPTHLPPFLYGAARFTSQGVLWVQRATKVDEPPTFDIIDEYGEIVQRAQLPRNRRLVGFGTQCVYAVRVAKVDLEYLERYRLDGDSNAASARY